jgi:hypothetical protein
VLAARRRIATASGRLEDLVPLGALLADLERFVEADAVYRQAYSSFDDVSPFPLAWVCFQLGMLWGELVPAPDFDLAAHWSRRAIAYLPGYVKARVHLAEIYASQDQTGDAEALLVPALSSRDPEVRWRLADVLMARGRFEEGERQIDAARLGFEELLGKQLLAFADHAAEFYAGSGNDPRRALELANANVANRPTRRALEQARAIASSYNRTAAVAGALCLPHAPHARSRAGAAERHPVPVQLLELGTHGIGARSGEMPADGEPPVGNLLPRVDILPWLTAAFAKAPMVMHQNHEPRLGKGFGHRFEAMIFGAGVARP